MVVIVDYGMGNLRSVLHKLQKVGAPAILSSEVKEIEQAEKIILPGVGAFAAGMKNLSDFGLLPVLNYKVLVEKTPILGICLGMQLFAKSSTEGNADGLGWLNAEVQRFDFSQLSAPPRIPHVGWNTVNIHKTSILFEGVQSDQRFYFTHSYHLTTPDQDIVLATTTYGYPFISAVQSENIYGVQFHPEKSHRRGLIVYQNFINKS